MEENFNIEDDTLEQKFTQEDIEKLATEKFEQYKYNLECDTYLEKNNISKEIKEIIKFDSIETLEKNVTMLKEVFGKHMPGLEIVKTGGAIPGSSNAVLESNKNNIIRKAFGLN